MSKRTKLAIFISAIAAVISAVVLIIVFWDKLLAKCPCSKKPWEEDEDFIETPEEEPDADVIPYDEEELADYADLEQPEAE